MEKKKSEHSSISLSADSSISYFLLKNNYFLKKANFSPKKLRLLLSESDIQNIFKSAKKKVKKETNYKDIK